MKALLIVLVILTICSPLFGQEPDKYKSNSYLFLMKVAKLDEKLVERSLQCCRQLDYSR